MAEGHGHPLVEVKIVEVMTMDYGLWVQEVNSLISNKMLVQMEEATGFQVAKP